MALDVKRPKGYRKAWNGEQKGRQEISEGHRPDYLLSAGGLGAAPVGWRHTFWYHGQAQSYLYASRDQAVAQVKMKRGEEYADHKIEPLYTTSLDALGPFFVRDMARAAGLTDDADINDVGDAIRGLVKRWSAAAARAVALEVQCAGTAATLMAYWDNPSNQSNVAVLQSFIVRHLDTTIVELRAMYPQLEAPRDSGFGACEESARFSGGPPTSQAGSPTHNETGAIRQPVAKPESRGKFITAEHLGTHFLFAIECDHEAKTDVAICACSQWRCPPQPSVGAAVDMWVVHVFDTSPGFHFHSDECYRMGPGDTEVLICDRNKP